MSRRIDVSAPLADVRKQFREESGTCRVWSFFVPVYCFACLVRKSWPARNARLKLIRQVDVGFRSKNLLNLSQRILTCSACHREKHCTRQSNRDAYPALMNKHFVLLNHGVATSEQVRISLNKFRLFQGTRCCRCRFPVLSTIRLLA